MSAIESFAPPSAASAPEPKKRKRVALWTLIVWTALMGVWVIAGIAGNDCASEKGTEYLSDQGAQDACAVGTGIGVFALVSLWAFVTFCIMAVTVIVRLSRRN
jgi:hypothetical protein